MRFLLVFSIWVVFVGGLYLYTSQRDATATIARESDHTPVVEHAQLRLTIELTPTFSIEDDPFALQTSDTQAQPIEIRLNGIALPVDSEDFSRGRTVVIRDVPVTLADHNELFIKASPPVDESNLDHGIRVRLLKGDQTLADSTVWNSGGGLVAGNVVFEPGSGDTDHEH